MTYCVKKELVRILVGQLGCITGQTRPDLVFEVCQLSSILNRSKVDDILKGNKFIFSNLRIRNFFLELVGP